MWVFTTKSFISIVQDRDVPDGFMVRARKRQHLIDLFPDADVYTEAGSDYKWRARIPKSEAVEVITQALAAVEYDNFKNAIPDHEYHDACSEVWSVMYHYQRGQK